MSLAFNGAESINSFAVVTYIPGPLGLFLDRLRRDLEPSTLAPRAHVTILPPRALAESVASPDAWSQIERTLPNYHAFPIHLGHIEIFPTTNVVYLSVSRGIPDLEALHVGLNRDALYSRENYRYHPHVTLAQGLAPEQAMEIAARGQRQWNDYAGPREFMADAFTFVQNTRQNVWQDLGEINLYELVGVPIRKA